MLDPNPATKGVSTSRHRDVHRPKEGTMSDEPQTTTEDSVGRVRRWQVNEDWAATVIGLALLVLALTGIITPELVP